MTPKKILYQEERARKLDFVLKKISQVGIDRLSTDERKFLDRVSAELRHELGWGEDPGYDYDED
jgi:hypothetical protein